MKAKMRNAALCLAWLLGASVPAFSADSTTALGAETAQMDSLAASQGEARVSGRIAGTFSSFAGSPENASSLVNGLRNGSQVTLTSDAGTGGTGGAATSTTFTPPTRPMGHGNVFISLALAKNQLTSAGVTQPTPQQLQAALMGGTITTGEGAGAQTVTMQGVLQMRADGKGWGQIANALGTKLGPVVSGLKSANAAAVQPPGAGAQPSGVTTAAGASATGSDTTAKEGRGASASADSGIVTATGAPATSKGVAAGKGGGSGIVTAGGGSAPSAAAVKHGNSGIVTAIGSSAGPGASALSGAGQGNAFGASGIVNAGGGIGGGGGHGLAKGHR